MPFRPGLSKGSRFSASLSTSWFERSSGFASIAALAAEQLA